MVDISPEQLERNEVAERKILGDLHELDLGRNEYDIAVAWDVIEHLDRPTLVVDKLAEALKPGGLLCWRRPTCCRCRA